jgi:hypothetical protein
MHNQSFEPTATTREGFVSQSLGAAAQFHVEAVEKVLEV